MGARSEPVGYFCPGCGAPALVMTAGDGETVNDTQVFCPMWPGDCPWFMWNPQETLSELNADVQVVQFSEWLG